MKKILCLAVATATFLFSGCTSEAAPKELRFSVLPDFHKAKLAEDAQMLAGYLTKELGVPVKYLPSNDYTGAVNNLISNKVDFVWLGGKTTCDAIDAGKGDVRVLATRDIDLAFKTYFIANKKVVDAGKVAPMDDLGELKDKAGDLVFTFGDKNSTSGHLMPRYFLTQAGIDPDEDFKTSGYRETGGHGATLKAVESGEVDLGALNFGYWDKASEQTKAAAPIVYTTPGYVDYAWVGHSRVGEDMLTRITEAFTGLSMADAEEKAILDAWSAKEKFLPAKNEQWDKIRQVRDSLPKGFLK